MVKRNFLALAETYNFQNGTMPEKCDLKNQNRILKIFAFTPILGNPKPVFRENLFFGCFRQKEPRARFEDTRETRRYESTELKKVNFSRSYVILKKKIGKILKNSEKSFFIKKDH